MRPVSEAQKATLSHWVAIYRERGLQPLPSRTDAKRPLVRFADFWEARLPGEPFDPATWAKDHPAETTNVQVMTGRHWRLLVIDLDGPEARERWRTLGACPRTWAVTSGGKGLHLWFRLTPEQCERPLLKGFLWKGDGPHEAIERLGDKSLVMAPPSIHPKTGALYRWTSKAESPLGMNQPAPCPKWLLALPTIEDRKRAAAPKIPRNLPPLVLPGDVLSLVRSWGVRITGRPSAKGWLPCHAIDREDVHPSAAIHAESGFYVDQGSGERLTLPDLAVRLNVYPDRHTAYRSLSHVRSR